MNENKKPLVGIGVILTKENKILLGKRKGSHGDGDWSFPGGHLEFGESWENCARREVLEETDLTVGNLKFSTATNDIFEKENKHYITIFMIADSFSGELKIMEPDKCEKWKWFEWDKLPENLFVPIRNLKKQEYSPFE